MTIHAQPINFEGAVATRRSTSVDRHLITLCRRAESVLVDDERKEVFLSNLDDAFMRVDKPARPVGEGACRWLTGKSSEMRAEMKKRSANTTPKDRAAMTTHIRAVIEWERVTANLKDRHGLTAARRASKAAAARSRKIVGDIAALPATTIAGLKAKCRAMKACIDTGYGHHDEFERLAISIYEDGAQLPAE